MAQEIKTIQINEKWCKGCGICVAFCPRKVLVLEHQKVHLKNPEMCVYCGQCEQRCPDYAIWMEEKENG